MRLTTKRIELAAKFVQQVGIVGDVLRTIGITRPWFIRIFPVDVDAIKQACPCACWQPWQIALDEQVDARTDETTDVLWRTRTRKIGRSRPPANGDHDLQMGKTCLEFFQLIEIANHR